MAMCRLPLRRPTAAVRRAGLPGVLLAAIASVLPAQPSTPSSPEAVPWFEDATAATGLDFVHFNGMTGRLYYVETLGGGAALLDADGDGDLDLYLVQGHVLEPGAGVEQATFPPRHPLPLTDRLYRNELEAGKPGTLRFSDVTARSGLEGTTGYGMGAVAGDFDNDGDPDLYVANFGPNQLLRNRGDGTFEDATRAAGVEDPLWTVATAWIDVDRDGWLDLFVSDYVAFRIAAHRPCHAPSGEVDYCGPIAYDAEPDRLYRNRGDGTFENVTLGVGLDAAHGSALGVVTADFDLDGWPDVYVANDELPNQLWMNRGGKRFEDLSLLAGAAVNLDGLAESSMGVDAADVDGDGDEDLFMTHLGGQTNTFYLNDGDGFFEDATLAAGLGAPSLARTGFGTAFLDVDNDGLLDLVVVNGAVKAIEELLRRGDPYPLHEPNQLYRNLGGGRFEDATDRGGPAFEVSRVSRGAAIGDLDRDGDTDLVVANNAGPAEVLLNRIGQRAAWVGLEVLEPVGDGRTRPALGARVGLVRSGRPTLWRRVRTDGSYTASNDPSLLFGLGDEARIEKVRVEWVGNPAEEWTDVEAGGWRRLVRGEGRVVAEEAERDAVTGVGSGSSR